jgi:hypothetical protein
MNIAGGRTRKLVLSLFSEIKKWNTKYLRINFLIGIMGGGVQLGPLGTATTNRPIVPAPGDYDGGEIDGMIGKGNRSTWRKPAPVPLCRPQTPHAARTRTRAAAVGSQRLTALATARPKYVRKLENHTNTLAVNLLDNSETTHRLKRYTVLTLPDRPE